MSTFNDLCGDPWQDHYFEGPNHPDADRWLAEIHADQAAGYPDEQATHREETPVTAVTAQNSDVYETVRRVTDQLDAANGTSREETGLRILKVTEEAGEVAAAWIGTIGQNPRKGVTHTTADVAGELADVVLTALVAIASLGYDPEQVVGACVTKVADRFPADS